METNARICLPGQLQQQPAHNSAQTRIGEIKTHMCSRQTVSLHSNHCHIQTGPSSPQTVLVLVHPKISEALFS